MKPSQLIARYIRGQLAMSGFTQQEAADAVGMVQQALSRRLTGQTPFTIDELTALVRYLGIDYAEMIDGVQRIATREAKRSSDGDESQKMMGLVVEGDDEGLELNAQPEIPDPAVRLSKSRRQR